MKTSLSSCRLQFSLRSFCVVMTMLGSPRSGGMIWLGWEIAGAVRDRAAIAWARSLHVNYFCDDECELSPRRDGYRFKKNPSVRGPDWLRQIVGPDYLRRIVFLRFEWRPITDKDLGWIVALMPDLWALHLEKAPITNAGLVHLRSLRQLRQLVLSRLNIDSASLANVRTLSQLKWLELDLSTIDDDALKHLRNLPALSTLSLQLTGITDAGLPELAKFPALTHFLDLNGTAVTDAGIESLKKLTRLKQLELGRTKITREGIRKLREALPDTAITQHETEGYENRNQILK